MKRARKATQLALVDDLPIASTRPAVRDDGLCAACAGQTRPCDRCDGRAFQCCDLGHTHDCSKCDGTGVAECHICDSTGHADAAAMVLRAAWVAAPAAVRSATLSANAYCSAGYPRFAPGGITIVGTFSGPIGRLLKSSGFKRRSLREWTWTCEPQSLPFEERLRLQREVESIKEARKAARA